MLEYCPATILCPTRMRSSVSPSIVILCHSIIRVSREVWYQFLSFLPQLPLGWLNISSECIKVSSSYFFCINLGGTKAILPVRPLCIAISSSSSPNHAMYLGCAREQRVRKETRRRTRGRATHHRTTGSLPVRLLLFTTTASTTSTKLTVSTNDNDTNTSCR